MANNLDYKMMKKELSEESRKIGEKDDERKTESDSITKNEQKDKELEKKMELVNKLWINWKVVMKENRREEERYKEEYEKGVRRKKDLEEVDEYFKKASEEMNKIEEDIDEEREEVYDVFDVLYSVAYIVYAKIGNEEEMRKRGERDYVSYWEKIREMISIARFCEVNLENMENMDREMENFLNSEVDDDSLEEEKGENEE